MPATFGIVDLFAGPGGLGEGFAALDVGGHAPFRIGISVEKEASAHRTLTLRAFLRAYQARHGALPKAFIDFHTGLIPEPDWSEVDAAAGQHATAEARCLELGTEPAAAAIDHAIGALRREFDDTILIGGPPCQAYSLVGRARAKGKVGYVPEEDERHYLFREYIRVLDRLRPAAFVMENVKGMLSSTVESRLVFEMLMEDLASLGTGRGHHYEMRAIRVADGSASLKEAAQPSDFIVRAEEWGVPQRRHRVIIVGIRSDLADRATGTSVPISGVTRTVDDAIGMMPELRSGGGRPWVLYLLSHFVAVTSWVLAMEHMRAVPRPMRTAWYCGLGGTLVIVNIVVVAVVYQVAGSLPPILSAALLMLTPLYFLTSLWGSARERAGHVAMVLGLVMGPLVHLVWPAASLLATGLIAGGAAYGWHVWKRRGA